MPNSYNSWRTGIQIDNIYPVGCIYMSVSPTNPGTLFGGTWEQIEDTFLLCCGTTYTAGSAGGSATHTHTIADNTNSTAISINQMPAHTHTRGTMNITGRWEINGSDNNGGIDAECTGSGAIAAFNKSQAVCSTVNGSWNGTGGFNFDASRNWTGATSSVGGGQGHSHSINITTDNTNNMPPYLAIYVFKRTA